MKIEVTSSIPRIGREGVIAISCAHRLSTVQHANEIIVMDAGRIVERGTHESLMRQSGYYRKLVELQAL